MRGCEACSLPLRLQQAMAEETDCEKARFFYSTETLLRLRQRCHGVPRKLRRQLFYYKLLTTHVCPFNHVPRTQNLPIEVRITNRREYSVIPLSESSTNSLPRVLVSIQKEQKSRKPSSERFCRRNPTVLFANVRSVFHKLDEVALRLQQHSPDAAFFCESWLDDSIPDSAVTITNYQVFRKDRNRHGGGILCYLREGLVPRVITENDVSSLASCKSEILPLLLPKTLLLCIYHPFWNSPVDHEEAISCIVDVIDFSYASYIDSSDARIIIVGDFNDLRHFYDEIAQLTSTKALVNFSTRGDHTLDQLFTNVGTNVVPKKLPPLSRSDHAAFVWAHNDNCYPQSFKQLVRNVSKSKKALFSTMLHEIDWVKLVNSAISIDESASFFLESIKCIFDLCFPVRTVRLRHSDPAWMKPSLKILIDNRDRAFFQRKWSKYYRLRDEVICHTRELKTIFVESTLSSRNSKRIWDAIRTVGKCSQAKSKIDFSANEFSKFFACSFSSPVDKDRRDRSISYEFENVSDFCDLEVDVTDVWAMMKNIKKKSPGPDGIPYWVFRDFCELLAPAITIIYNGSLRSGKVPLCFKEAYVTPVPKCAKPVEISNYRPISLLPILSKCLERIVSQRWILPFIRDRINVSQFAYLPGRGTTVALTLLYNRILQFLDSKSGAVRILCIDFAKAFDKLPHISIVDACQDFCLPSPAVRWITDFLSNRRQCVRLNGDVSQWHCVSSGVPQGSIVGPLLFSMVVDSLSVVQNNSSIIKYADDVNILHFVRESCDDLMQSEWDNVMLWSNNVGLPVNFSKCVCMNVITKKSLSLKSIAKSDGTFIENVDHVKILGVLLSNDLKWNLHVNRVVSVASRRLYILCSLKKSGTPPHVIKTAYLSFVRSILLYCSPVFVNAPHYLQRKLQRVESRASRIIGERVDPDITNVLIRQCEALFSSVLRDEDHPLRFLFRAKSGRVTRSVCPLRPPHAKSARFMQSFIKFCK